MCDEPHELPPPEAQCVLFPALVQCLLPSRPVVSIFNLFWMFKAELRRKTAQAAHSPHLRNARREGPNDAPQHDHGNRTRNNVNLTTTYGTRRRRSRMASTRRMTTLALRASPDDPSHPVRRG